MTFSLCRDLTAEQIQPPVLTPGPDEAVAYFVDQWGKAHQVTPRTEIGRGIGTYRLGVLHPTVSSVHAAIAQEDGCWRLEDRGSRNGTFVNGKRTRAAELRHGDVVAFGAVCFVFASSVDASLQQAAACASSMPATAAINESTTLAMGPRRLSLGREGDGGQLILEQKVLFVSALEISLIELLVTRVANGSGFVSSSEMLMALPFRSDHADGDNLRQLVRRLRRKLKNALGIDGLIESRQGVGYRLGWALA
jgi:hypothetical protein